MKKKLHFTKFLWLLTLFFTWQGATGQTSLTAGDIAIIGANFDNPDQVAFVLLKDIEINTEIKFTDNGWLASGSFRTGEGTHTWTAPSAFSAGKVILVDLSGPALAATGDQLLVYQGTDASPTFIYALNSEGTGWQADAADSNTSAIPTGLTDGTSAIAIDEVDNMKYTGITSGTVSELLSAIGNKSNWSGDNTTRFDFSTLSDFAISTSSIANPTAFTATAASTSQINLGWTKNGNSDNVIVAWNTANTFGTLVDGSTYSTTVNTSITGGGTIIYDGTGTSHSHTSLTEGTQYFYKAWSVDGSKAYSGGVTANATTKARPSTQASGIAFSSVTSTGFTVSWTRGNGANVAVFVKEGTAATPVPADGTTYTASADWSSKGTEIATSTGYYCVYNGTGTSVALTNLTASTAYDVVLFEYNEAAGSELYKTTLTADANQKSQTTPAANDGNSKANTTGVTQPTADVSSTTTTEGAAVEVFQFNVNDAGTSDGLNTTVTQVKVFPGTNNTAAWSTAIAGARLYVGSTMLTATVNISDSEIAFSSITGTEAVVTDNTNKVFSVKIWLNASVTDNEVLEFKIPQTGHGFEATGTTFAADFGAEVVSNQLKTAVTATKLAFVQNATNAYNGIAMFPAVTIQATDANGNRDLDATNSVSLTSSGTMTAVTNITLASGFGLFGDIIHTADGTGLKLTAAATGLTNAESSTFDVTTAVKDLFFSEYIEGSASNKALEIYNPTDNEIDLSGYAFPNVTNEPTTPGVHESWNTFPAGAKIAAKGVYVIADKDADPAILAVANHTHESLSNGDDGYAIAKGTEASHTIIDYIGDFQADPGDGWAVAGTSKATKDHTLVRKSPIIKGNADWTASAGTGTSDSEWEVLAQDEFTKLGWHIVQAPTIKDISHTPTTPDNTQAVTVSAGITDNGTVSSANVKWGTTQGSWTNTAAMAISSGTTYTATIAAQTLGTTVYYVVEATDDESNTHRSVEASYTVKITPTKLAVKTISPASPEKGATFEVTVEAQNAAGVAGNVTEDTGISLSKASGTGTLGGTLTATITHGTSSVTLTGLSYDVAENIELTAAVSSGMTLTDAVNQSVTISDIAPTTQASAITFEAITTSGFTIKWTNGNGAKRAVFVKEGAEAAATPSNSTTYTASLNWSTKGTQIGTTGYYCVYNGTDAEVTVSGLAENQQYSVLIFEYNGTAGNELYNTGVTADANKKSQTTASAANDADSKVVTLTQPTANVSSLANAAAEAVEVFKFQVKDLGTSDANATKLTKATLTKGANNTASWTTTLEGAKLFVGASEVLTASATITDQSVVFDMTTAYEIASGSDVDFTVKVWLKTALADNQILEFAIPKTNHGFVADVAGSGFATDFDTDVVSEKLKVDVVATKLAFVQNASNAYNGIAMFPAVTIQATDANANRDLDATNSVSLTSSGTMTSVSDITLVSGFGTFGDIIHTANGTALKLTASATGLTSAESSAFDVTADSRTLFFSEYIEGSVNNKAVEIYNPTEYEIDLADYVLKQSRNGGTFATAEAGYVLNLSGKIPAKGVYVVANADAGAVILSKADTTFSYTQSPVASFNGDDALGLFYSGTLIDIIGREGEQLKWDVAGTTTATGEHTLVRKYPTIITGNTNWTTSAGTNLTDSEWEVYNQDEFSYLGWHGVQAPKISAVSQLPQTPAENETVSVKAVVTDEGTVADVKLKWGTATGIWTNEISMTLSSSSIYTTATDIPSQTAGSAVYYVVEATDNDANKTQTDEYSYITTSAVTLTQIAISEVSPVSPTIYQTFSVTVQAQDADGTPGNVSADTEVELNLASGTGSLAGTLTGTISKGTNAVTISGLTYNKLETIELSATVKSGMTLANAQNKSVVMVDLPTVSFPNTEDFTDGLGNFTAFSVSGSKAWGHNAAGYVEINGFESGETEEDWLILAKTNLSAKANANLSFDMNYKYGTQDADNYLKLKYSNDYIGTGSPAAATWTEIEFALPENADEWVNSGFIDISAISGSAVYFAFQYRYTDGNYTRWQIDNFKIDGASSKAQLLSSEYTINEAQGTITDVPYGTYYLHFIENIEAVDGGSFVITDADGNIIGSIKTGHKVVVTAQDGITTKSYVIQVNSPTAIETQAGAFVKVYPNPVSDVLVIENTANIQSIELFSADGKYAKVFDVNNDNSLSVEFSNLKSGFYILNLVTKTGEKSAIRVLKK